MSIRKLMKLGVVAAMSAAMFGCGGGGGGEEEITPPPETSVQGAGVDDYILNGTVQAWKLDGTPITLKGANGGSCTTGEFGIFNCTAVGIDENTALLFAIKGGKLDPDGILGGNQTDYEGALLAFAIPKEPVIISPVTTKVVSEILDIVPQVTDNETFVSESALIGIGDKIDDKIKEKGVNATELVEKQTVLLPAIVENPEKFDEMVKVVGDTLSDLREKGKLDDLVNSIVVKVENGTITHTVIDATIINDIVQIAVANAGNDTEVAEAVVQSALPTASETTIEQIVQDLAENNTETLESATQEQISSQPAVTYEKLLVTPTKVCGGDNCSEVQYGFATEPITVSSDEKIIKVSYSTDYKVCTFVNGITTCNTPQDKKEFKDVVLAIKIDESNGAYADVTLSGVNVTVNTDGTLGIEVMENATLKIYAKKSNGEVIDVTLTNEKSDLSDTFTVDNDTIGYNLSDIEAKLESAVADTTITDTSLIIGGVSVQKAGTYDVSVSVIGAPIMSVEGTVIVNPAGSASETTNEIENATSATPEDQTSETTSSEGDLTSNTTETANETTTENATNATLEAPPTPLSL